MFPYTLFTLLKGYELLDIFTSKCRIFTIFEKFLTIFHYFMPNFLKFSSKGPKFSSNMMILGNSSLFAIFSFEVFEPLARIEPVQDLRALCWQDLCFLSRIQAYGY